MPILIEEYASKLHNLTPLQLEDIAKHMILDKNQQDLVLLHNKMNHHPFPAMIKLAENRNIDKRFAKLKNIKPVYMSCVSDGPTVDHGDSRRHQALFSKKAIQNLAIVLAYTR